MADAGQPNSPSSGTFNTLPSFVMYFPCAECHFSSLHAHAFFSLYLMDNSGCFTNEKVYKYSVQTELGSPKHIQYEN